MSNTETEKNTRKPVLRLLIVTVLLTLFYLAANCTMLKPGILENIAGWIYSTLPLEQVFLTISNGPLNVVYGFVLQLLYLWIVIRFRYNMTDRRAKGESIFKNKLDLIFSCVVWAFVCHWFQIVCEPMFAITEWGGYAAELTHYLLEVYTLGDMTLTMLASGLWLIAMFLCAVGFWAFVAWIFEKIMAKIKGKRSESKAKTKGTARESTRESAKESTTQKKNAVPKKEKEKPKAQSKPRSGVSAIDTYAASAADERLKKYMNSNVPVEMEPCIRVKLLSASDAMDMEMIRPFQPDGSLFVSLDCGSFTYEMAFRLDEKGNAYILGNEDEPLSPNAPHAACSKIDGKSVPQIFIEYIKV